MYQREGQPSVQITVKKKGGKNSSDTSSQHRIGGFQFTDKVFISLLLPFKGVWKKSFINLLQVTTLGEIATIDSEAGE